MAAAGVGASVVVLPEDDSIRGLDPALEGGAYRLLFDREVPIELRIQENEEAPQQVGTLEPIRAKVLISGDASEPTSVKLQLSSEKDIFLLYEHLCSATDFLAIQEEQSLMIDFSQYADILCTNLDFCIQQPQKLVRC
jgi:hypothetical protein